VWLWLVACTTPWAPCRSGWSPAADGHCWPVEASSFEEALDDLPACEPLAANSRLDLEGGCVDGACAYAPIEPFEAAFGPGACVTASWSAYWVYCYWSNGVDGLFPDGDLNLVPDPGAAGDRVEVKPPYDGTTEGGLGLEGDTSCFVETLGDPERVVLVDVSGVLTPDELWWPEAGVRIYDETAEAGGSYPDTRPDRLVLYGPP
jgi:hypothetical protein